MPRKLRIQYPGAIYHVMNRGDRREAIFKDDHDRRRFLEAVGQTCEKTGWHVHAFCLMSNHFHLVVETPQPNLVAGKGNGVKPYICDSDLTFWLGLAKPLASCRAKCECNIPAPCIT